MMVCEDFTVIDIDPEMQQKQPFAPYELDRKMKTAARSAQRTARFAFSFGGPCADVVPTCRICCYERYQKYHANNGSSSVKRHRRRARIPKSNHLLVNPGELKNKANGKKRLMSTMQLEYCSMLRQRFIVQNTLADKGAAIH